MPTRSPTRDTSTSARRSNTEQTWSKRSTTIRPDPTSLSSESMHEEARAAERDERVHHRGVDADRHAPNDGARDEGAGEGREPHHQAEHQQAHIDQAVAAEHADLDQIDEQ